MTKKISHIKAYEDFLFIQLSKTRKLNAQYASLEAQKQVLIVKEKYLRAQKNYMQSDAFVEMTARKELGLVKPGEHLVLSAKQGTVRILEKKPVTEEIKD